MNRKNLSCSSVSVAAIEDDDDAIEEDVPVRLRNWVARRFMTVSTSAHRAKCEKRLPRWKIRRRFAAAILLAVASRLYLAIIASNCSGVLPVGSYSSLPVEISSKSISNSSCLCFLVAGDGDSAGGSSSSLSSGELYTTSVPDEGELRPIAVLQFEGAAIATCSTLSSGGDACRINHVACKKIITCTHSNLSYMCCSPIRHEHC